MTKSRTVRVDIEKLRLYRPESEEADTAILGAAGALRIALQEARIACPDLPMLDPWLDEDLVEHYGRCRVLADLFDEVADRFKRSQVAGPLPNIFGPKLAGYVGPWIDVNTPKNREWIQQRLRAAREAGDARARQVAASLWSRLNIDDARPFVISRRVIETKLGVSAGLSAGAKVEWEVEELSNGTTTVALRKLVSLERGGGTDIKAKLAWGDTEIGGQLGAAWSVGVEGGEGRKKTFASRSAADAFIASHEAKALAENLRFPVPFVDLFVDAVADTLNASGMRDAPVEETIIGGTASISANGDIEVGLRPTASGSLSSAATITEETDSRDKTRTDQITAVMRGDVGLLLGGQALSERSTELLLAATVTRDTTAGKKGQARSMTLRVTYDDKAGELPELITKTKQPESGVRERKGTSRYELEVEVDLTDPRNARLQKELSTAGSGLKGRLDEDAVALSKFFDKDLVERSAVTIVEQTPIASSKHGFDVNGLELGAEAGRMTTGYRTVDAWQKVGGTFRQVELP